MLRVQPNVMQPNAAEWHALAVLAGIGRSRDCRCTYMLYPWSLRTLCSNEREEVVR